MGNTCESKCVNLISNCFERMSLISSSSMEKEKISSKIALSWKSKFSCTNQTGDAKEEIFTKCSKDKI